MVSTHPEGRPGSPRTRSRRCPVEVPQVVGSALVALAAMVVGLVALADPAASSSRECGQDVVAVTLDDGNGLAEETSVANDGDCTEPVVEPSATITWECGDADISVGLDNSDSQVPVEFTISHGGEPVVDGDIVISAHTTERVVVSAARTEVYTVLAPPEGEGTTVTVEAGGQVLAETVVGVECEEVERAFECDDDEQWVDTDGDGLGRDVECTEVLGDQVTATARPATPSAAPAALALTGPVSTQLLWAGVGLVLLGLGLVVGSRRLRVA